MKSISFNSSDRVEQLTLDLFPPRSFNELCSEQKQRDIEILFNSRLRKSWYVKINRNSNRRELHLPPVFENAPEEIKLALIEWVMLSSQRRRRGCRQITIQRRKSIERRLFDYLAEHSPQLFDKPKKPFRPGPTKGCRWDLKEVFDSLNEKYFCNRLSSFLRWGCASSKTSYQSTRKDNAGKTVHCITIAGIYNHPSVPRFAIESIMYHEMLHIHIPPRKENDRTITHGKDFKMLERSFPHYPEWRKWERETLPLLFMDAVRTQRHSLYAGFF